MTKTAREVKIGFIIGILFLWSGGIPSAEGNPAPPAAGGNHRVSPGTSTLPGLHPSGTLPEECLTTAAFFSAENTALSPSHGDSLLTYLPNRDTIRGKLAPTGIPEKDTLRKVTPLQRGIHPGDTLQREQLSGDTLLRTPILQTDSLGEAPSLKDDALTITSKERKITPTEEELHSPRKASIYSAILPGLGQAYNKKYWKIPIIYGGFAAFGYFIRWNNRNFTSARQAYSDLTDTIPGTDSYMRLPQIIYYDLSKPSDVASLKQGLTSSQNYYRRNRDLLIIVTAAFYGLNIIDASVDAHFFNFDISDDLSLNWEPVIRKTQNQNIFCLNCTFRF